MSTGKTLASLVLCGVALFSTAVPAQEGDAGRGAALAETCMGCHGIPGYRNAYPSFRVPKLGGQHAEYIVIALRGYRDGTRGHDTMHAQAASLSDQDMQDIAAWFASQGPLKSTEPAGVAAPDKATTCVACHGEGGISVTPMWPTLAGQHEDYLAYALRQYLNGERTDPVMSTQAQSLQLTEEDIRELAAYYAAQSGLFTPKH